MLTIGSLFAGIGGLELGLERAGVGSTVWQVERDPYARAVLARHWPDVRRHDDVTTFPPAEGDWSADVICGGFPCQDLSNAGRRAGLRGARSGLFFELMRVVRVLRPRFVVLENVAAILGRGAGEVLGELAACGFDAEWDCVPASSVGAPHQRDRFFCLAHARRPERRADAAAGHEPDGHDAGRAQEAGRARAGGDALADAEGAAAGAGDDLRARQPDAGRGGGDVADADGVHVDGLGHGAGVLLRSGPASTGVPTGFPHADERGRDRRPRNGALA